MLIVAMDRAWLTVQLILIDHKNTSNNAKREVDYLLVLRTCEERCETNDPALTYGKFL